MLAEIQERLEDPACRLLTLVRPGGSGKTRLALEAGAKQIEYCEYGVWFVQLKPLENMEGIVPAIADGLGFRFHEG